MRCLIPLTLLAAGCGMSGSAPELVWGSRGVMNGELVKPRAVAIDRHDRVHIVDFTARIQSFDRDGKPLGVCFTTPDYRNGRPSGLSVDRDGNILVSDSHYHYVRTYSPEGVELKNFGGITGSDPGQLGYISDALQDNDGFYFVAEFGQNNRISKFDEQGQFIKCWGEPGSEVGQFAHIRALALGPDGLLYVADSCNHRIQMFTREGEFVRLFGTPGQALGELRYPYDLAFDASGHLYVVEYENCRVQKFTTMGAPLAVFGGPGRDPGKFDRPWGLAVDGKGRVHVLDSENHRVQRIAF